MHFWGNIVAEKPFPRQLTKQPPRICNQRVWETKCQAQTHIQCVPLRATLRDGLRDFICTSKLCLPEPLPLTLPKLLFLVLKPWSFPQPRPCPSSGHSPSSQHLLSTLFFFFQYSHFPLACKTLLCLCPFLLFLLFAYLCQLIAANAERLQRKLPFVPIIWKKKKKEWNLPSLLLQSVSEWFMLLINGKDWLPVGICTPMFMNYESN